MFRAGFPTQRDVKLKGSRAAGSQGRRPGATYVIEQQKDSCGVAAWRARKISLLTLIARCTDDLIGDAHQTVEVVDEKQVVERRDCPLEFLQIYILRDACRETRLHCGRTVHRTWTARQQAKRRAPSVHNEHRI